MKKWNLNKVDCRNCKHFYVCAYHKGFKIKDFLEEHLMDCMKQDNLAAQRKSTKVIYKLLVNNCRYFNKDA